MRRIGRRSRKDEFFSQVQDPGKDLFAYLFLVMLIFSFVILVSYEEKIRGEKIQKAPQVSAPGKSRLVKLKNEEIGRLVKKDGRIFLVFGGKFYSPDEGIKILEKKGIIKTKCLPFPSS